MSSEVHSAETCHPSAIGHHPKISLLNLPGEIRNAIWEYSCSSPDVYKGSKNLRYLETCRQISQEAAQVAFANTVFVLESRWKPRGIRLYDEFEYKEEKREANKRLRERLKHLKPQVKSAILSVELQETADVLFLPLLKSYDINPPNIILNAFFVFHQRPYINPVIGILQYAQGLQHLQIKTKKTSMGLIHQRICNTLTSSPRASIRDILEEVKCDSYIWTLLRLPQIEGQSADTITITLHT